LKTSPATIIAYAIGIKDVIPNFGSLEISQESNSNVIQNGIDIITLNIDNDWVVSCPGGEATYSYNKGRLLSGIGPDFRTVVVTSTDCPKEPNSSGDTGSTIAYAIKIRKQRGTGTSTGGSGTPGH
jgi:hypothetical protein